MTIDDTMPSSDPPPPPPVHGDDEEEGHLRRLDRFDPMMNEQRSRSNAYAHLVEEQQPYRIAGKEEDDDDDLIQSSRPYVLMVYNAPPELKREGILNLFNKHGKVVDVVVPARNLGWRKVIFASHMEAQSAIQALDKVPPWNLSVKLGWTDEEKKRIRGEQTMGGNEEESHDESSTKERYVPGGRGKQLQDFVRSRIVVRRPRYFALFDQAARAKALKRRKKRVQREKVSYSSASENEDEDDEMVDARHLNLSRMDPSKLPVKEFGHPLLLPATALPPGGCHYCLHPGRLRCSRCKIWYCTLRCQIKDWPSHERDCKREDDEKEKVPASLFDESFVSAYSAASSAAATAAAATAAAAAAAPQKVVVGCRQSVLKSSKIGSVVDFYSRDGVGSNVGCFPAMALENDEAGLYVTVTMQSEMEEEKKRQKLEKKAEEGEFVAYLGKMDGEEMYFRGFVLEVSADDDRVTILCIDNGMTDVCPLSLVYSLPDEALSHPALAVRFTSDSKMQHEMEHLVRRNLEQMTAIRAEYREVRTDVDERCEASVALLDKDDERLVVYRLQDWTSIDSRAHKLLGVSKPKLMASDVSKYEISDGDDVFFLECGRTTDLVVVQSVGCVDKVDEVTEVMRLELDRERLPVSDVKRGELVASRWSKLDDDTYFRTEILSVDPNERLARVRFVDHGISSIEPLDSFVRIPERAITEQFPIFTQVFKMADVPSLPSSRKATKVRLKHLRPQTGFVLRLRMIDDDDDDKTSKNRLIRLEHPNGRTLNEMMKMKLTEIDESAGPGDMQGMCVGGAFDYDRCHAADLAVRPSDEQSVVVLHFDDPLNIFMVPIDQISTAYDLADRIAAHVNRAPAGGPSNYSPPIGKVCLALAKDGQWYRGVCLRALETENEVQANDVFFPDFGFAENVLRTDIRHMSDDLMATPFVASHCALEGFVPEDADMMDRGREVLGKRLVPFEEVLVVVVRREGHFVIRIPSLEKELTEVRESR